MPQLLRRNAERTPDRPALREKDLGIWRPYSWRRYCEEVRDFASGLAAEGLSPWQAEALWRESSCSTFTRSSRTSSKISLTVNKAISVLRARSLLAGHLGRG